MALITNIDLIKEHYIYLHSSLCEGYFNIFSFVACRVETIRGCNRKLTFKALTTSISWLNDPALGCTDFPKRNCANY